MMNVAPIMFDVVNIMDCYFLCLKNLQQQQAQYYCKTIPPVARKLEQIQMNDAVVLRQLLHTPVDDEARCAICGDIIRNSDRAIPVDTVTSYLWRYRA